MDSGAWKMFCAVCVVLTTLVIINSCSAAEEKKRSVDAVGTYLLKRRNDGEPLDNEPFAVESWQDELDQAGRHRAAAAEKRPSDSVGSYLLRRRTADSVGSYLLKRNAKTASASSAEEAA